MNLSAVILAGGQSSRMGRDKAWVEFEGRPLISRALDAVRSSGITDVLISGRAGTDYSILGCPVLLDRESGFGPLAGIERALDTTEAPLLLVLAVDLPRMTAGFLRKLASRCDSLTGVVPKLRDRLEPLAAVYPKRCRFIARDCLLKCRLAARDFADACLRERAVKPFVVPPADQSCFDNWNRPADIAASEPNTNK
jgi:molybdopterin-guanine dinucleotide biosynthesis protein A